MTNVQVKTQPGCVVDTLRCMAAALNAPTLYVPFGLKVKANA